MFSCRVVVKAPSLVKTDLIVKLSIFLYKYFALFNSDFAFPCIQLGIQSFYVC